MIGIVGKLIARRLLTAIPILLAVSALLFCVLRVLPVDPAAMSLPPTATLAEIEVKRHEMGLDKPLPEQYFIWLADALHGDFGPSIQYRRDSGSLVAATLPATIQLSIAAMVIAAILGVGGGLLLFRVRDTAMEPVIDFASILLLSKWRQVCRCRASPASFCSIHSWSGASMFFLVPSSI
jgi:peptide/nickel transport system permease protein